MLALLNSWPIGEYSRRIEFEIRTERDKKSIRKVLLEVEQWVKAVEAQRAYYDCRRMKELMSRLAFALLHEDYKQNAIDEAGSSMDELLSLVTPIHESRYVNSVTTPSRPPGIQKGTAFIIMAMRESPELEDTCLTIKRVCKDHGFQAFRADDLAHGGLIIDKIRYHIASAELLIGDLTGELPNVYFEIGCALTMRKEPILFRKYGTKLHFDLAAYNVPEYRNFSELENLLGDRLTALGTCSN